MGSIKSSVKKVRLVKARKLTKWAPFWIVPKIFGMQRGRHIHPSRVSTKRSWRRNKIKD